jgi:hypothetical protein
MTDETTDGYLDDRAIPPSFEVTVEKNGVKKIVYFKNEGKYSMEDFFNKQLQRQIIETSPRTDPDNLYELINPDKIQYNNFSTNTDQQELTLYKGQFIKSGTATVYGKSAHAALPGSQNGCGSSGESCTTNSKGEMECKKCIDLSSLGRDQIEESYHGCRMLIQGYTITKSSPQFIAQCQCTKKVADTCEAQVKCDGSDKVYPSGTNRVSCHQVNGACPSLKDCILDESVKVGEHTFDFLTPTIIEGKFGTGIAK